MSQSLASAARMVAASGDPQRFLRTVANVLMGFGGGIAAVILIIIGFKVLVRSSSRGRLGPDDHGSGLRDAFQEAGHVLVGLFFIFGAFFVVGVITAIVNALQK